MPIDIILYRAWAWPPDLAHRAFEFRLMRKVSKDNFLFVAEGCRCVEGCAKRLGGEQNWGPKRGWPRGVGEAGVEPSRAQWRGALGETGGDWGGCVNRRAAPPPPPPGTRGGVPPPR